MKKVFKTILSLSIALLLCLAVPKSTTEISADGSNMITNNDDITVIYADLSDEENGKIAAQKAFNEGAKIVNVKNKATFDKPVYFMQSGYQSNYEQFWYGDILHGSNGTISCYVVTGTIASDHVTNCSLKTKAVGNGVSIVDQSIKNDSTFDVYGQWKARLSGWLSVDFNHKVYLFE